MALVKVLFVYPHDPLGEFIDAMEGSGEQPSHVAVFACGGLLEAIAEGVVISPADKYADCKTEAITVNVPYLELGEAAGYMMEGDRYSVPGCIEAFIHDKTGIDLPIAGNDGKFCSEVGLRYLRCAGLNPFPMEPAKHIEPYHLRDALRLLAVA